FDDDAARLAMADDMVEGALEMTQLLAPSDERRTGDGGGAHREGRRARPPLEPSPDLVATGARVLVDAEQVHGEIAQVHREAGDEIARRGRRARELVPEDLLAAPLERE